MPLFKLDSSPTIPNFSISPIVESNKNLGNLFANLTEPLKDYKDQVIAAEDNLQERKLKEALAGLYTAKDTNALNLFNEPGKLAQFALRPDKQLDFFKALDTRRKDLNAIERDQLAIENLRREEATKKAFNTDYANRLKHAQEKGITQIIDPTTGQYNPILAAWDAQWGLPDNPEADAALYSKLYQESWMNPQTSLLDPVFKAREALEREKTGESQRAAHAANVRQSDSSVATQAIQRQLAQFNLGKAIRDDSLTSFEATVRNDPTILNNPSAMSAIAQRFGLKDNDTVATLQKLKDEQVVNGVIGQVFDGLTGREGPMWVMHRLSTLTKGLTSNQVKLLQEHPALANLKDVGSLVNTAAAAMNKPATAASQRAAHNNNAAKYIQYINSNTDRSKALREIQDMPDFDPEGLKQAQTVLKMSNSRKPATVSSVKNITNTLAPGLPDTWWEEDRVNEDLSNFIEDNPGIPEDIIYSSLFEAIQQNGITNFAGQVNEAVLERALTKSAYMWNLSKLRSTNENSSSSTIISDE